MFEILNDKTICLTRGDVASLVISAVLKQNEEDPGVPYTFTKDDVVRFAVFKKRDCLNVLLQKDVIAQEGDKTVTIHLTQHDTKIGEYINKPAEYWYEIVLNPDTNPQTLVGYDKVGEKIFRLYPEGGEVV